MAETKTIQKNWKFTPETISELEALCKKVMRSQQNMVEVLIHAAFEEQRLDEELKAQGS